MMISIKIQCGCGQRYAFDVEPVNGRTASPVACPACGADGTDAANAIITQTLQSQPTVASKPKVRLHVATPASAIELPVSAPAPHRTVLRPGHVDPAKAEAEARSKIFWGDPPKDVVQYLMMNGFSHEDAAVSVRAMFRERAAALQGIGIKKIVLGIGLLITSVVALLVIGVLHIFFLTLFAIVIMVGLWGAWLFFKGSIMVLLPRSETGDVADK